MCWTGIFSYSPETCIPINCTVFVRRRVRKCVCMRAFVYLCVFASASCRTRGSVGVWRFSRSVCVRPLLSAQRSALRPAPKHSARCFFLPSLGCAYTPHVVCIHISLLMCRACISTGACELGRWRGDWLVFMNKRHNCDRMIYELQFHSFSLSFPFFSLLSFC